MTTDSMVEKMARAIARGLGYEWDTLYASKGEWTKDRGSRHDINVPYKPDFIDAARAALEAMREPTVHQTYAMHEVVRYDKDGDVANCAEMFTAAIDAALKEGE